MPDKHNSHSHTNSQYMYYTWNKSADAILRYDSYAVSIKCFILVFISYCVWLISVTSLRKSMRRRTLNTHMQIIVFPSPAIRWCRWLLLDDCRCVSLLQSSLPLVSVYCMCVWQPPAHTVCDMQWRQHWLEQRVREEKKLQSQATNQCFSIFPHFSGNNYSWLCQLSISTGHIMIEPERRKK